MDIDLLSKMVKELILDNDEVTLPGVGSFIAEIVPSSFSDKGYTINPPYRRLSFRQKEVDDGGLLTKLYAKSNNIDTDTAARILKEFLTEMRNILEVKKIIIFPGLGRLRATRENHFFFIADEDLDIYPEGFGLEPISLKTHEETMSEVSETIATLRTILDPEPDVPATGQQTTELKQGSGDYAPSPHESATTTSEPAPDDNPAPIDIEGQTTDENPVKDNAEVSESDEVKEAGTDSVTSVGSTMESETAVEKMTGTAAADEIPGTIPDAESHTQESEGNQQTTLERAAEPKALTNTNLEGQSADATQAGHKGKRKGLQILKWTIIVLVVLALTALAAFLILARIEPDFIDSILYTPEELEILNL